LCLTNGGAFGASGTAVLDLSNLPTIRTHGGSGATPARLIVGYNNSALPDLQTLWTGGIMSGYTLSLAGTNNSLTYAGNLTLTNGAVLTHEPNIATDKTHHWLSLAVTGGLTIASGSALDVSGRGYKGRQGPGGGTWGRGGGGHGGQGGRGLDGGSGAAYGLTFSPISAGSGGHGHDTETGPSGAGVIRLTITDRLTVNGAIRADGRDHAAGTTQAGGAGGSVWITAGTLAGTNAISAVGGIGRDYSGGGGGGRIAISLTGANNFGDVTFLANGGDRIPYHYCPV
jgi:hypothetical protein